MTCNAGKCKYGENFHFAHIIRIRLFKFSVSSKERAQEIQCLAIFTMFALSSIRRHSIKFLKLARIPKLALTRIKEMHACESLMRILTGFSIFALPVRLESAFYMTGQTFWVGLKATLEKIGIPQGENNHNQNFLLIFLFVCLFFGGRSRKKPIHLCISARKFRTQYNAELQLKKRTRILFSILVGLLQGDSNSTLIYSTLSSP